jgi:carbon-monoxide dehydrogenase small subunit
VPENRFYLILIGQGDDASLKREIKLNVNGKAYDVLIKNKWTLADVLRDELGLTGTKKGCDEGECGACTVLMDGKPVRSCLSLAIDVRGRKITTIEGIGRNGELDPVQEAFIEQGAIQCGFCTPGMILSAKALLDTVPHPNEDQVKTAINGNLCRCTGYVRIVRAVLAASQNK